LFCEVFIVRLIGTHVVSKDRIGSIESYEEEHQVDEALTKNYFAAEKGNCRGGKSDHLPDSKQR
jgi:hypothetical protein